jgi:hypothetical protein
LNGHPSSAFATKTCVISFHFINVAPCRLPYFEQALNWQRDRLVTITAQGPLAKRKGRHATLNPTRRQT